MGFCDGGDLYNRLKEQKSVPLEEKQVVEWFVQIAMALQVRIHHSISCYPRFILWKVRSMRSYSALFAVRCGAVVPLPPQFTVIHSRRSPQGHRVATASKACIEIGCSAALTHRRKLAVESNLTRLAVAIPHRIAQANNKGVWTDLKTYWTLHYCILLFISGYLANQ